MLLSYLSVKYLPPVYTEAEWVGAEMNQKLQQMQQDGAGGLQNTRSQAS